MQSKLRFEMVMEIAKTTFIRSWNFIYKGIKSGSRLFPVKREKKVAQEGQSITWFNALDKIRVLDG